MSNASRMLPILELISLADVNGTTVQLDPLAVLHLDNQIYLLFFLKQSLYIPSHSHINYSILEIGVSDKKTNIIYNKSKIILTLDPFLIIV